MGTRNEALIADGHFELERVVKELVEGAIPYYEDQGFYRDGMLIYLSDEREKLRFLMEKVPFDAVLKNEMSAIALNMSMLMYQERKSRPTDISITQIQWHVGKIEKELSGNKDYEEGRGRIAA